MYLQCNKIFVLNCIAIYGVIMVKSLNHDLTFTVVQVCVHDFFVVLLSTVQGCSPVKNVIEVSF